MSSVTLVKAPAAPDIPEDADSPRIVPQRRLGQWIAAVAVLVLLGLALGTLKGTSILSVIAVQDPLYSVQLVRHRAYAVIPLLMVATVWCTVVTSVLGVGRY